MKGQGNIGQECIRRYMKGVYERSVQGKIYDYLGRPGVPNMPQSPWVVLVQTLR